MTKAQKATARELVRSPIFRIMLEEIVEDLPAVSPEEVQMGKFSDIQLAHMQVFQSGAIHMANSLLRKGMAPRAKRVTVQPRHLKPED